MISIRDLAFRYPHGEFHLRVPKFQTIDGERVAVVGGSGSGKTTLLELVSGIRLPMAGTITVAGEPLSEMRDIGRRDFRIARIGLIFRSFELLEYLTVRENVPLPYRLNGRPERDERTVTRVNRLAQAMAIDDRLERRPKELSHGERQRVAICRALVNRPDLILADEPTGNLDPANKRRVLDLLLRQVTDHGTTLLMVTHDRDLPDPFDRVVDMGDFRDGAAE